MQERRTSHACDPIDRSDTRGHRTVREQVLCAYRD